MTSMTGNMGIKTATGLQGNKIPSGYNQGRLQNFTPEQMNLFQQLFSQVSPDSFLSKLAGGDQTIFNQIEAPALQQFAGLQGNIASRFSQGGGGPGALGARKSSGFQNTMNQEASNFAQQLQAQRQQLQRQAVMDLMGISNQLLGQKPYEQFLVQKQQKPSFLQSLIGGAAPLAGAAIGGIFGGPMGAALGSGLGSSAASGFLGQQSSPMNFSSLAGLPTSWGSSGGSNIGNSAVNSALFGKGLI